MTIRSATRLATTALVAALLLSGCGLLSSIRGLVEPPTPTAVLPFGPDLPPGVSPAPGSSAGADGGGPAVTDGPNGGPIGTPGPITGVGVMRPGGEPDDPTIVTVHPGQADVRDVSPVELTAVVEASGHVIVRVRWWGGVEPCEILDSVAVTRTGSDFTIAARVGSAPGGQVACILIARDTATLVDLGVLSSGRYTARASIGDAPAITIVVP